MTNAFKSLTISLAIALVAGACGPLSVGYAGQDEQRLEPERANFRALKVGNPNYFGTLKESPFKAVKSIQLNTKYEEIKCVGFNPDSDRLEAVVYIKQPSGYLGGVCTAGSPEYVRFYLSYDGGTSWDDQGIVSFRAYDIPGDKPLEYAVTLRIDPAKGLCSVENLPKVRAILSWNEQPPADSPHWLPVWGDVENAWIQLDALKLIIAKELFAEVGFTLPPKFEPALDLMQPLELGKPAPLNGTELHTLYHKKAQVEPHRYLYNDVQKLIVEGAPTAPLGVTASPAVLSQLPGIDWTTTVDAMSQLDGNTQYEELTCIGLDTRLETLVGVLTVKLPAGYSGNLCSAGSTEYVAFWVDWDESGVWDYVGTAEVNVHDIKSIPSEGLQYAVHLSVDAGSHRRPCFKGAKTARVRAILSWQTAPPPYNPHWRPKWGNGEDTLVHIPAGSFIPPGQPLPELWQVGGMSPNDIHNTTGLANGPAVDVGFKAIDSPFGGSVYIVGKIYNAPDLSSGVSELEYRIRYRKKDSPMDWKNLDDPLEIKLIPYPGGISAEYPETLVPTTDGWYKYKADPVGPNTVDINGLLLGVWKSHGETGKWQLKIEARDGSTPYPGSQLVTLQLDNDNPDPVGITITSGGGACADFKVGDPIEGTYSALDDHFNYLTIWVSPGLGGKFSSPGPLPSPCDPPSPCPVMPLTRSYLGGVSTSGESGVWKLDTTGMPKCGYIIGLEVWDRTIVNSGYVGRRSSASVGLCLRKPEP